MRIFDRAGQLLGTAQVTVRIGPIGPLDATVKWRRGEYVGLQFDKPLYPSILDHIRQHFDLRS